MDREILRSISTDATECTLIAAIQVTGLCLIAILLQQPSIILRGELSAECYGGLMPGLAGPELRQLRSNVFNLYWHLNHKSGAEIIDHSEERCNNSVHFETSQCRYRAEIINDPTRPKCAWPCMERRGSN